MGEAQHQPKNIMDQETKATNSPENAKINRKTPDHFLRQYIWWFQMVIYTIFLLSGQSVATLLGRLYYNKGGNSIWIASLVLHAGFPAILPFLFLAPKKNNPTSENADKKESSFIILFLLYLSLGIFLAADSMLYAIGLLYLPVSTYTLICATQLGFNALFSFFLNSQKFTPFIINSLVLLTISSIVLVFSPDSSDSNTSKGKYAIGFLCTVSASAGYALILSITQFAFQKMLKRETFHVVLEMIIYQSAVASCVVVIGLFVSGNWKSLIYEIEEFELGSVSYVTILVSTAVSWQLYTIGAVGLIFKVSSLFSNVISTFGLPIVPVLAVFIFNDKMNGVKVVSMVLAVWGFVSYIYQHYLDDLEKKAQSENVHHVSEPPLIDKC